jgi:hypothetical protein
MNSRIDLSALVAHVAEIDRSFFGTVQRFCHHEGASAFAHPFGPRKDESVRESAFPKSLPQALDNPGIPDELVETHFRDPVF